MISSRFYARPAAVIFRRFSSVDEISAMMPALPPRAAKIRFSSCLPCRHHHTAFRRRRCYCCRDDADDIIEQRLPTIFAFLPPPPDKMLTWRHVRFFSAEKSHC